ncbi:MAG: HAMP domain-containing protein [Oscillospiraceae bacterium]|nr:HAMP domain-containing protein [Oscillospiraceae bacterium]
MGRVNSLRTKLVIIMVLLILALMAVVGAFLISGVSRFYIDRFYDSMEQTFSQDFQRNLRAVAEESDDPPAQLKEMLMAQSDLGIDIATRNVYILDENGKVLASSSDETEVATTNNLLSAMNGEVGEGSSVSARYMDLAVPVETAKGTYIVYILDNRATVDDLTGEVLTIVLRSLALGVAICIVLAFLLSRILITPIRALTIGTRQVAAGDFSQKLEVSSHDEIGTLTRNFNDMARVLQSTLTEVENERTKLSTLFLTMTDGVTAFSPAGRMIHYNPAATQMLSRNLDPAVTFGELFGEEANFADIMALKRPDFFECEKHVGDRELELFMAPFATEQAHGGVLVVIHDVTEQRRNDQTRREFVANVSHELRTPLTNVKSYAETIISSGSDLPEEMRNKFLGVIVNEADRMTRIVQDLLTLSKFDYGKMEMTFTRFSLKEAVQHVCEAERIDAENHRHTLTLALDEGDELPVSGDQERIEQVVMNVVSNAIKYTPDGGKIRVSAGRDGKNLFVLVSDNGIGIPEKDLPHLYERFYRVDKARSRQSGGTGLGLSIAQEILNLHNGSIRIESVFGEGTDVRLSLPAAE